MLFSVSLLDWLGYFDTLPKPIPKSNLWGWSQEGLVSIKGYGPSVYNAIPDSKLVPKMGNHPASSTQQMRIVTHVGRWPIVVITTSMVLIKTCSLNKCIWKTCHYSCSCTDLKWFETPNWEGIVCQTHFVCSLIQKACWEGLLPLLSKSISGFIHHSGDSLDL